MDGLKAIESVAVQLAEQRDKINKALEGLRLAVFAFDDTKTLNDAGIVVDATETPEPETTKADAEPPAPEEPHRASPAPDREAQIIAFVAESTFGKREDQIVRAFPQWNVHPIVRDLVKDQKLKKAGSYLQLPEQPPPLEEPERAKPDAEKPRGSGLRRDTAGTVRRTTAPPAQAAATKPELADDRGLARSPKPRSEMKSQQVDAERRLDAIISWALGQGDEFESITARRDLGVSNPKSEWYKPDALFGNDHQASQDFKELADRGIIERTGRESQPRWKVEAAKARGGGKLRRDHGMGRGTYIYRWRERPGTPETPETTQSDAEAVAEPPPAEQLTLTEQPPVPPVVPTLEQVRDVAVRLKSFHLVELFEQLHLPSTRITRRALREHMAALVSQGMFTAIDGDGKAIRWEYVPIEPGKIEPLRPRGEPSQRATRQNQIAGTGRKPKATNPQIESMLNFARKAGAAVTRAASGHWEVKVGAQKVLISSTPSGSRSILNDKARLRRLGIAVP